MLKLKDVCKKYQTGDFIQNALTDINLEFNRGEFTCILGPSGSGKTTLLNILGGLDRYDSGDIIINGKSTKDFKDRDFDYYRNNCIGFIFQSYNLINHISILDNVEMALTLSGEKGKKKRKKAIQALKKVGLEEHIHKRPMELSGGQMQRVAIARAIVNNPDIILADEPTGALDSETSIDIMELIRDICRDKLVIMVTHNGELAERYATRIITLKDGEVLSDSKKKGGEENDRPFVIKKTAMGFGSALKLSFNNIITKKGRTILTSFASSIGIIGIALILSLSNGFDKQIDIFEREALSNMPIIIGSSAMEVDQKAFENSNSEREKFPTSKVIFSKDNMVNKLTHTNNISDDYVNYVKDIPENIISGIIYNYMVNLNIISSYNGFKLVDNTKFMPLPRESGTDSYMDSNYDLIGGNKPSNNNEILILVDSTNGIDKDVLSIFGLEGEEFSFDDIIGKELKVIDNNDYYSKMGEFYVMNTDYEKLYNSSNSVLKVVGIVRAKESNKIVGDSSGILYRNELTSDIISVSKDSDIVKSARSVNYNVLNGEVFRDDRDKKMALGYLGDDVNPASISIYPRDFDSKDSVLSYLDDYNRGKDKDDRVVYTDLAKTISGLSSNIMSAITVVLVAFSGISLVVSSIMIGIITYISVLERTKEIGILRSLGARKKDIARVFNAEVFLIGLFSGVLGIGITYLLLIPVNGLLYSLTDLKGVASLNPVHAIVLIVISIVLTLIGGMIPSKMASKKDPVKSLRSN